MLQTEPSLDGGSSTSTLQRSAEPPPFAPVLELEARQPSRFVLAAVFAAILHVALGSNGFLGLSGLGDFARIVQASMQQRLKQSIDITMEPQPEPEPEPAPEPEPEPEPEPAPKPPPAEAAKAPPPEAPTPPPAAAAAQAGQVLAAEADPDEPLELTGNTFVQGNADYYAGGVTASKGTSSAPVRDRAARADGVIGGRGTAAYVGVDRSRVAGVLTNTWDCPFPAESELEQINYQTVTVTVAVSAAGRASSVKVIGDTQFGFGRAAQRCALKKAYQPALSRDGTPIESTITIVVAFERR